MIYKVVKQALSKELTEFVYSYFLTKRKVARKYFDESDWHPAHGTDYYRPLDLSVREFYAKSNVDGYDWYKWKEMREDLLSVAEMVEALEEGVIDLVMIMV